MPEPPQDVEPGPFRPETLELSGIERGTRIRLSAGILGRIDWAEFTPKPECWGIFRQPGELLCAPRALTGEDGRHPFTEILAIAARTPDEPAPRWSQIPSARVITAPDRVISFPAAWSGEQLLLKIGRDTGRRLGWSEENEPPIYLSNWARILIVMSQSFYESVLRQDLSPKR